MTHYRVMAITNVPKWEVGRRCIGLVFGRQSIFVLDTDVI